MRTAVHLTVLILFVCSTHFFVSGHPAPPKRVTPEEPFADKGILPEELHDHHDCIHDDPALQRDIAHHGMDASAPQKLVKDLPAHERSFHTLAVGSMRIVIDTSNLDDTSKHCESASGTSTDMRGGTVSCTADSQLTAAKRSVLLNNLLPRAIERIADRVSVDRIAGNLVLPSYATTCGEHDIPASHRSTGVANADFVLYVSGAPTSGSTRAWAGYCVRDGNGRPISGRANFNPKYLDWELDGWSADSKSSVGTATHELMHAMGFTSSLMSLSTVTVRGQSGKVLKGANVIAKAKEHFGCNSITQVEVDQDTTSHWEQRNLYQELMNPVSYYARAFSKMTLAYLDDLDVGYTVDYNGGETMDFAYQAGCGFLDNDCTTAAGGYGTWFCKSGDPNYKCDPPRQGMGTCFSHAYTNDCRIYVSYSNWYCNYTGGGSESSPTSNSATYGRYLGAGGRCFDSSGFRKSSGSSSYRATCVQTQCPNNGQYVQYKLHSESTWRDCPTDGSEDVQTLSGWVGTITCPPARVVCDPDNSLAPTPSPATPTPPTPQPGTPQPGTPQPATTTAGTPSPPGAGTPAPVTTSGATPSPGTQPPATPQSTTAQPTTPTPTTAKPTTSAPTPQPATPQPPTPRPPTPQPATPQPTTAQPTTAQPTTQQPATSGANATSDPSAAPPTTDAPLECPGFVGVLRGRMRIRGSFFALILNSITKRTRFAAAYRRDLARVLRIAFGRICIRSLSLGSLVVDYAVADGTSATEVNATMQELAANETAAQNATSGNGTSSGNGTAVLGWMSEAAAVYFNETNTTAETESLTLDVTSLLVEESKVNVGNTTATPQPTQTPAPLDDVPSSGEPSPIVGSSQDEAEDPDSSIVSNNVIAGVVIFLVAAVVIVVGVVLYRRSQQSKVRKNAPNEPA